MEKEFVAVNEYIPEEEDKLFYSDKKGEIKIRGLDFTLSLLPKRVY